MTYHLLLHYIQLMSWTIKPNLEKHTAYSMQCSYMQRCILGRRLTYNEYKSHFDEWTNIVVVVVIIVNLLCIICIMMNIKIIIPLVKLQMGINKNQNTFIQLQQTVWPLFIALFLNINFLIFFLQEKHDLPIYLVGFLQIIILFSLFLMIYEFLVQQFSFVMWE